MKKLQNQINLYDKKDKLLSFSMLLLLLLLLAMMMIRMTVKIIVCMFNVMAEHVG